MPAILLPQIEDVKKSPYAHDKRRLGTGTDGFARNPMWAITQLDLEL